MEQGIQIEQTDGGLYACVTDRNTAGISNRGKGGENCIHALEGMGGIESFMKGMVIIWLAQNYREPQSVFQGSLVRGSIKTVP